MHYGPKAFSRNGQYTMLATNQQSIGQRQGLSASDIKQANILYGCISGTVIPTQSTVFPSPSKCELV